MLRLCKFCWYSVVRRRGGQVGDGRLADTPGFNQPSFDALTPADLPDCFPEIRARLGRWLVPDQMLIFFVSMHCGACLEDVSRNPQEACAFTAC